MKTSRSRSKNSATITNSRWLAYATAGAASAFTCANSAEAAIHYSGPIHEYSGHYAKNIRFQLDQPGDSFRLRHYLSIFTSSGFDDFGIIGLKGNGFAGFYCSINPQVASVSKLSRGQPISTRPFVARQAGKIARSLHGGCLGQFGAGDIGFIGFKFNNGSGDQYGWVRIKVVSGEYDIWIADYAYADPGEPIRAGQISSNEMVSEESNEIVPAEGSLGWLALGAVGLLAWRKRRSGWHGA